MAFVQRRKGPDVVGSFGLLQPLADGLKLIIKEPISPSSANFSLFRMAPVATFMLSLVAWAVVPFDYGMVLSDPNIGLLYLFAISSLGVYGIIIAGWSSKTGGGRSVAYDIRTNWSKMGLCRRCWTIYSTQVWAYRARAHKPFLSFRKGSVTFPGRDREVEVIKKRCFSSHLISRGKVACPSVSLLEILAWFFFHRLFFFVNATKDLTVRLLDGWKNMRKGYQIKG